MDPDQLRAAARPLRGRDVLAASVPPAIFIALLCIYLVAPEFYLRNVLEERSREGQLVERLTAWGAFLGAVTLGTAAWRLHTRSGALGVSLWRSPRTAIARRGGCLLLAIMACAAFFFWGEELSWGQHFFGWKTPESYAEYSVETNLHNFSAWWMPSVQSVGSVFLCIVYFALPLWWKLRPQNFAGIHGFAAAAPAWPAIFAMGFAFGVKLLKGAYRAVGDVSAEAPAFYTQYLEQINEQHEMLIAFALVLHGVYALAAPVSLLEGELADAG